MLVLLENRFASFVLDALSDTLVGTCVRLIDPNFPIHFSWRLWRTFPLALTLTVTLTVTRDN